MGRPRMIIVIRHAQSEGNRNRDIHQTVPDHRVKLTADGWAQAEDAGRRLRGMLRPDDTLQFYTSPYRRTRETTEGIVKSLTSDSPSPSPFPRHTIKVWEEPRLREQDFGNFQPCSSAMNRMWQERADYGHFFYRIPNGESAADAYDRISGFNESLWRSFAENDFPSVCVLVTHGLMTRVFLMKWFHWSVEYFEDLRNVNHCEFVVMKRNEDSGKFILQNDLRTWSELKRKAAADRAASGKPEEIQSPPPTRKRWGGCPDGCSHELDDYPKRAKRQDAHPEPKETSTSANAGSLEAHTEEDIESTPVGSKGAGQGRPRYEEEEEAFPRQGTLSTSLTERRPEGKHPAGTHPDWLEAGRDFGGSRSGLATPVAEPTSRDGDYGFHLSPKGSVWAAELQQRNAPRSPGEAGDDMQTQWVRESGMGSGARADALGDQLESDDSEAADAANEPHDLATEEKHDKSVTGSVY